MILAPGETLGILSDDDDEHDTANLQEGFAICVLPALLFLRFGMSFYPLSPAEATARSSWGVVNVSIVLLVVSAHLY
jgi:hypothetical protein